jgi:hypothetical protein
MSLKRSKSQDNHLDGVRKKRKKIATRSDDRRAKPVEGFSPEYYESLRPSTEKRERRLSDRFSDFDGVPVVSSPPAGRAKGPTPLSGEEGDVVKDFLKAPDAPVCVL